MNSDPSSGRPAVHPKRRQWLVGLGVAGAAAAGGVALAWWQRPQMAKTPDAPVAAFLHQSFPLVEGGTLSLAEFDGQRLLVNFWAPWCAPCVEELPMLDAVHRVHRARGWRFLGLAADRLEPVQRFVQTSPVSFPIALAGFAGIQWSKQLGNESGGLPFTAVFDRAGRMQLRKLGQLSRSELDGWMNSAG